MRIAHDVRAKPTSDLKKQQGTAMASIEGGGVLQTIKELAATHPRSLAAILARFSRLQKCQAIGTR